MGPALRTAFFAPSRRKPRSESGALALGAWRQAAPAPNALSFLFGDTVFPVQPIHVPRVVPDDEHVDDQGPLTRHPPAERPTEKGEIQAAREIADHERHEE